MQVAMVATSETRDSGLCVADAATETAVRVRPAELDAGGARVEQASEAGQEQVAERTPSAAAPSTGDALSR